MDVVKIVDSFYHEAREAKRERMRKNEYNRNAAENLQDWRHKVEGQSKEFIPKTAETLQQFKSFIKRGLTQFGDWFSVSAEGPIEASSIVKLILSYLDSLPDGDKKTKFTLRLSDAVEVGLLESLMIFKIHGRPINKREFIEKDGKLTTRDVSPWRLQIDLIPPDDYYPDPTGAGLYEIHEVERDFAIIKELSEQKDENDEWIYDPKVVAQIDEDFRRAQEEKRKTKEQRASERKKPTFRRRVVLREFWGTLLNDDGTIKEKNVTCTIANEKYLIRKVRKNPFWHQESPFVAIPIIRVPFSVWHKAIYDQVVPLNLAMNEMFNLMLDGGIASVWGIRQLRADLLADPRQVSGGIPQGKTLLMREDAPDGAKVIEQVAEGQVPPEAMGMYNLLDREANTAAMTNELTLGNLPVKQVRATEIAAVNQSQSVTLDSITGDIEEGIEEVIRKAYLTILQNADLLSIVELENALSPRERLTLARMTPAQRFASMANGAQFKVFGLSETLSKTRDFQRLMALLQIAQTNPLIAPAALRNMSPDKLWKSLLKMMNVNPKTFERDETDQGNIEADLSTFLAMSGQQGTSLTEPTGEKGMQSEINQEAKPTGGQ